MNRRSFLIGAGAAIVTPVASKIVLDRVPVLLSPGGYLVPENVAQALANDFTTDALRYKSFERYDTGYHLFRQAVEPILNEYFDGVYEQRLRE